MKEKVIILACIVIIVVIALFGGLSFTGQFLAQKEFVLIQEPIIIGVQTVLSGDAAVYGEYGRKGITLAVEEINSVGGVNGKKLVLIYEDDAADPSKAINALEKLLLSKPSGIISFSGSGATLTITPIIEEKQIPTVIGLASNSKIQDAGDYIFRITPSDSFQGKQWAEIVKNNYKKPAILVVNNSWGTALKETFIENFYGEVFVENMEESASDVRSQLLKIKEYSPDVLIMPCYIQDCITATKQMRELGLNFKTITGDVFFNQEILDAVGNAADGFVITRPADSKTKEWIEFREKFIAKYGEEPNIMSAYAYDAMYTMYYALQNSNLTREGIKSALYKTDFIGPSGANKFDSFGEVEKGFSITTVKEGKFVDYKAN